MLYGYDARRILFSEAMPDDPMVGTDVNKEAWQGRSVDRGSLPFVITVIHSHT
jgi:hypothetical protein